MLFKFLLIFNILCEVAAFSNGAPTFACADMLPAHRVSPQNSVSAIRIETVNETCYSPNRPLELQISGGNFKGFLVQARTLSGNGLPIGNFTPQNRQAYTQNCNSLPASALTHSNSETKTNIRFVWNVPSNPPSHITFRLTALRDYYTFWLFVDTSINLCMQDSTVTNAETTVTDHPTTFSTIASTNLNRYITTLGEITDTQITSNDKPFSSDIMHEESNSASRAVDTTKSTNIDSSLSQAISITEIESILTTTANMITTIKDADTIKPNANASHSTMYPENFLTTLKINNTCKFLQDDKSCRRIPSINCYRECYRSSCCNRCNKYFAMYGRNPDCPFGDKVRNCSRWRCRNCTDSNADIYQKSYLNNCCYTCKI